MSHESLVLELRNQLKKGGVVEVLPKAQALLREHPKEVEVLKLVADAFRFASESRLAIFCLERALKLVREPRADLLLRLGEAYADLSEMGAAEAAFREAIRVDTTKVGMLLRIATLCRPISQSTDEIKQDRSRLQSCLRELESSSECFGSAEQFLAAPGFYFSYHGISNEKWRKQFAESVDRIIPSLNQELARQGPRSQGNKRMRIGFFSHYFYSHAVQKLSRGILEQMDSGSFEIVAITDSSISDEGWDEVCGAVDEVVRLDSDMESARARVASLELDALVFTDAGMCPLSFGLPFARLAPIQCELYLNPEMSGLPQMDYYITASAYEPHNPYLEASTQRVVLNSAPCYYHRPKMPAPASRRELGLPDTGHVYLCPQSLFKLHPDFDVMLRGILAADPEGWVCLIAVGDRDWPRQLKKRFAKSLGDRADRVVFLQQRSRTAFLQLLAGADVLLDPIYYSGVNTAYESLAVNALTVTLPTALRQGRVFAGLYRQIGFRELIAEDADDYVRLAVSIASDAEERLRLRGLLSEVSHRAFHDSTGIRELEAFLLDARRCRVGGAA